MKNVVAMATTKGGPVATAGAHVYDELLFLLARAHYCQNCKGMECSAPPSKSMMPMELALR